MTRRVFGPLGVVFLTTACASARPEVSIPGAQPAAKDIRLPDTESVEVPPKLEPRTVSVVSGEIRFARSGGPAVDLGATVVYLRPRDRTAKKGAASTTVRIASATEQFAPPLTVVRPGQNVVLVNNGPLVHHLFSPDLEETFELAPEARSERFSIRGRGPTRFYCALHTEETFVIYSEDAEHVSVATGSQAFRFYRVPPGRYTLAIWSERVSGPIRDVYVDGLRGNREPIWLYANLIDP